MFRKLGLDEILDQMDDGPLGSSVSGAIDDTYGYDEVMAWSSEIPEAVRIAGFALSMTGHLSCEGPVRLLSADCKHTAYVKCLEVLGFSEIASDFSAMIGQVPEACLGDMDALIDHFGSWDCVESLFSSQQNARFASSVVAIESSTATYIRNNRREFLPILPAIWGQFRYIERFNPEFVDEYWKIVDEAVEYWKIANETADGE